jgi:teichuronic acid biosynthesis glycosyltransferase TuaG
MQTGPVSTGKNSDNTGTEPLVSIIMPAYNAEQFLAAAIRSVLRQSYQNWELLIVNDGSTDKTPDILNQFDDLRIRFFSQKNRGVAAARNVALSNMRGDFYCFLDADDLLPSDSLIKRVNKFYEGVDYVDGGVRVFDHAMNSVVRLFRPTFHGKPLSELFQLKNTCFFGPSWMIRRVDPLILFHEGLSHGEDLLHYMEVSRRGGCYEFADGDVYFYRSHRSSAMNNLDGLWKGYRQIFKILRSWQEFTFKYQLIYQMKVRKFMFLAYLAKRDFRMAVKALAS